MVISIWEGIISQNQRALVSFPQGPHLRNLLFILFIYDVVNSLKVAKELIFAVDTEVYFEILIGSFIY